MLFLKGLSASANNRTALFAHVYGYSKIAHMKDAPSGEQYLGRRLYVA